MKMISNLHKMMVLVAEGRQDRLSFQPNSSKTALYQPKRNLKPPLKHPQFVETGGGPLEAGPPVPVPAGTFQAPQPVASVSAEPLCRKSSMPWQDVGADV